MQRDHGTSIHVRNRGRGREAAADGQQEYAMSQPIYEVPKGAHARLNHHCFVATVLATEGGREDAVVLQVFRLVVSPREGNREA